MIHTYTDTGTHFSWGTGTVALAHEADSSEVPVNLQRL
jgi:hypothetical protein